MLNDVNCKLCSLELVCMVLVQTMLLFFLEHFVTSHRSCLTHCLDCVQVTRLIPNANGTTCNQRIEQIEGTKHSRILRVPFRNENGILHNWISRFDVYPFLENFVYVSMNTVCTNQFKTVI